MISPDSVGQESTPGKDATLGTTKTGKNIRPREIVALHSPERTGNPQASVKRWRAHVPFIAQYIGQETAIESPKRTTRRHVANIDQPYGKPTSLPLSPKRVLQV